MKLTLRLKGGPGSGHHGHSGRPGKRGGSGPGGGGGGVDFGDVNIDYLSRMWNEDAVEMLEHSKNLFSADEPTNVERKVVYDYTQKDFRDINSQLHDGDVSTVNERKIINIDSAIDKSTVNADVYVYRGGGISEGVANAYTSTSMSKHAAASFAAGEFGKFDYKNVARIKIPVGSNALFVPNGFTKIRSENKQFEVLLPRGSEFISLGNNEYELN